MSSTAKWNCAFIIPSPSCHTSLRGSGPQIRKYSGDKSIEGALAAALGRYIELIPDVNTIPLSVRL